MTDVEVYLSVIYTAEFSDPKVWTPEDHLKGLEAVFIAGLKAVDKVETGKK